MGGYLPVDVCQQAIDASGVDYLLGDVEDGTREAQTLLRAYTQCLPQLLRAAPWDWARRETPLTLLADASGNTPNVGTLVVGNQFNYEYAFPTDCAKLRYIPAHRIFNPGTVPGNIVPPNAASPLMTGIGQPPYGPRRVQPARFLISNDMNYPPPPDLSPSWETQGVSPQGRVVILTDVKDARAVYTYLALYPSVWDSLFRAGLVAYIASEIALPLNKDKKLGLTIANNQREIAKEKIMQARAMAANESGVNTSDLRVDWIDTRRVGGARGFQNGWAGGGGGGDYWGGYDDCCGAGVVTGAAF
jgi:hypothetical protein